MKDYLAIIRKLDFVDLFKYGHFSISFAVPFDGNVLAHAEDKELFDSLTSRMNMYEYSFEYLIIHFKANEYNGQYIYINIRNVCALYTFDYQAKKEMSISFDPRIQLHVSPWVDKFNDLHRSFSIKQSLKGVENLWTIFDLPGEDLIKCEEIIKQSIVQEVFRELYSHERPSGNQSIWTYLLRYERHSFYSKEMIGYFCDFIHVYCNYSKKQELSGEVAETTQLFPQIKACKNQQFASLIEIVKSSPLYKLTEDVAGCRFAVAAPLFLFLKAKFAEGLEHKPKEEFIKYARKVGGFECSIAIYLLGLSLGYDKTYDAFYESVKLPFFKKIQEPKKQSDFTDDKEVSIFLFKETVDGNVSDLEAEKEATTNRKEATDKPSEDPLSTNEEKGIDFVHKSSQLGVNTKIEQKQLFPENCNLEHQEQLPIIWMRNKKQDVRPVFDEDEQSKLVNLGYEPVKKFNNTVKKAIEEMNFNFEQEKRRFSTTKSNKNKK